MRIFTRQNLLPFLAGFGLLLTSCSGEKEKAEPIDAEGYRIYTIKAGEHDCDNEYKKVATSAMHFSVMFDSSAVYQTIDPVNQYDINKLYGLADCNTAHHSNSARMGWRWVNKQLEIHAYVYKNGKRNEDLITTVPIGKPVKMSIEMLDSTYIFKVGDKFTELARGCSGQGTGYKLYPYFGGDETAPHEIKVKVKDL